MYAHCKNSSDVCEQILKDFYKKHPSIHPDKRQLMQCATYGNLTFMSYLYGISGTFHPKNTPLITLRGCRFIAEHLTECMMNEQYFINYDCNPDEVSAKNFVEVHRAHVFDVISGTDRILCDRFNADKSRSDVSKVSRRAIAHALNLPPYDAIPGSDYAAQTRPIYRGVPYNGGSLSSVIRMADAAEASVSSASVLGNGGGSASSASTASVGGDGGSSASAASVGGNGGDLASVGCDSVSSASTDVDGGISASAASVGGDSASTASADVDGVISASTASVGGDSGSPALAGGDGCISASAASAGGDSGSAASVGGDGGRSASTASAGGDGGISVSAASVGGDSGSPTSVGGDSGSSSTASAASTASAGGSRPASNGGSVGGSEITIVFPPCRIAPFDPIQVRAPGHEMQIFVTPSPNYDVLYRAPQFIGWMTGCSVNESRAKLQDLVRKEIRLNHGDRGIRTFSNEVISQLEMPALC
jgi:hypothetical protein